MAENSRTISFLSFTGIIVLGLIWAYLGSNGQIINQEGWSTFALVGCYVFLIHAIAFLPSYYWKTEKVYDLVGSLCFATTTCALVWYMPTPWSTRSILIAGAILLWTLRLGIFLFIRVIQVGKDRRFDEIKKGFGAFAIAWSLSALWVYVTAGSAWVAILQADSPDMDIFAWSCLATWIIGWVFEATADAQKSQFRKNQANKGKFIQHGLWAISRHPNYFGELVMWCAIAGLAGPTLSGLQYVLLVSPAALYYLLRYISGINLLEAQADQKFGENKHYQRYKKNVPILVPWIGSAQ